MSHPRMSSSISTHTRRSAMTALFASAGLSSSGYIAAIIVAPLIAEDLLGSAALSGLPSAFTVIGTADQVREKVKELEGFADSVLLAQTSYGAPSEIKDHYRDAMYQAFAR